MKKYGRDNRPYLRPVTRIELSEKNIKLRWILIIVLMSVAVVSIIVGVLSVLNTEPGWQQVETSSTQPNCSMDFVLMYDLTDVGGGATAQMRTLNGLYTEATENAYRIFSPEVRETGLYNVAYLNDHVNESVTVCPELYKALELVAAYDNRHVFMAPAVTEYNRIFLCETDAEAAQYDPARNPETAAWLAQCARFASDPEMIRLELTGNDQVRLCVSDAYLEFAREYGIETYLDFGWMKNAFIADYLADILIGKGFTNGYLVSYDGFTRNLDSRGQTYSFNLFDRQGTAVEMPAVMYYDRPMSIVFLRNYPMAEEDRWHYYAFADGSIVTVMLDPATGMCASARNNLVAYSGSQGCAEVLMQIAPVFIADTLNQDSLNALKDGGIFAIWFDGNILVHNDPDVKLQLQEGSTTYTVSPVK